MESKALNPKDIVGTRKAPMSTISAPVIAEIGVAMLEGACKYGRHNYRSVGVRSSVYYDATMRHLMSWWEGEDLDPDSGMSHITKALASLFVLRDSMLNDMAEDDRPPRSKPFYPRLNDIAGSIIDRHADKNPRHYTIADTLNRAGFNTSIEQETFGEMHEPPWIEWTGGVCPEELRDDLVEVALLSGQKLQGTASGFDWSNLPESGVNIVAYRMRKP